jgi:hypothetical protein
MDYQDYQRFVKRYQEEANFFRQQAQLASLNDDLQIHLKLSEMAAGCNVVATAAEQLAGMVASSQQPSARESGAGKRKR